MKCRGCNHLLIRFFSLGKIPLANSFLKKNELSKREEKFDLSLGFCDKCFLVQLINTIPPKKLFEEYIYFSSTSKLLLKHFKKTANHLTRKLNLRKKSLVFEIASNDGGQLLCFKKFDVQVLGIDPAKNIAKIANKKGIETIPEFFNYEMSKKLRGKEVKADLVYGANVLAHVPRITDFLKGVKHILKSNGTAVFEFPYLEGLMENKFDIIYHEHVFYYSIISLLNLFNKVGLEIYDIETIDTQGGSLRIFAANPDIFPISNNVGRLKCQELNKNFDKIKTYKKISKNIQELKKNLTKILQNIKNKDKTIAAYGAAAKGNILLNYFKISDYIDFIVDKSEKKQGLYTPGTHLLVHHPEKIDEDKPDYLLILCWNIYQEIIKQLKNTKFKGCFILPIPKPTIL